ncbi:MAG: hypothetical protein NWQ54_15980 [Paraglaciecola sp.]|uniref:hypothetical protein n=1 Tax=Paraglaciecola sp. TaxID=1920173 RepID=UPI00273F1A9F|nr:hypothetical protein [Paraglaciecola sp.]MDP5030483.1 hypothetical protein [Paraglaciecola sp.]MDP5132382.1 hypothetical protein [Paraglaciecola sp.]
MHFDKDYNLLVPTYSRDFNTCFYCGCIATEHDYAPPIKYREFYLATKEPSDFVKIPCCAECNNLLQASKGGSLDERRDFAKEKLAKKYDKALTIYEMWSEHELVSLDFSLRHSIEAGLKLGEETTERLKYRGFDYEAAGVHQNVQFNTPKYFDVFGDQFSTFREALDFASKAYRIPKNTLKEYFADNDNNFEKAIHAIHKEVAEKDFKKQMKSQCGAFAKKYKQSVIFVHKQVERYMSEDEEMTINEALERLYEERVRPSSSHILK